MTKPYSGTPPKSGRDFGFPTLHDLESAVQVTEAAGDEWVDDSVVTPARYPTDTDAQHLEPMVRDVLAPRFGAGPGAHFTPETHQETEQPQIRILNGVAMDLARADDTIREDLCRQFCRDDTVDASGLTIAVEGGRVLLGGVIDTPESRRYVEQVIARTAGVRRVESSLRVSQAPS
jgi:hypothetical protein